MQRCIKFVRPNVYLITELYPPIDEDCSRNGGDNADGVELNLGQRQDQAGYHAADLEQIGEHQHTQHDSGLAVHGVDYS